MKKQTFVPQIFFFLFFTQVQFTSFCQTDSVMKRIELEFEKTVVGIDSTTLVKPKNEMPEFPGGERKLRNHITTNIRYPVEALEAGVQGKVVVQFVIGKDGELSDFHILKGIGYGCDEEAIRIVKKMPKWIPGKIDGKPVPVWFTLPISFKIEK